MEGCRPSLSCSLLYMFVKCIRCQICTIRPTDNPKFINGYQGKKSRISQWLEHWSEQPILDRNNTTGAICKDYTQPVIAQCFYISNFVRHTDYRCKTHLLCLGKL